MSQSTTHARRVSGALLLILCVAALCALPWLLPAGQLVAAVQMLIAALFACAFNLLAGQGGMLSFGHAAYFGVGTFATIHAMNALGGAGLLPTPLMPLVGGVAGLLFGLVAGWFATMRSGVYFSMITLALAELLHAGAAPEGRVRRRGRPVGHAHAGLGLLVRLGHRGLFPGAGLAGIAGRAVRPDLRTPLGRLTLGLRENAHRLRYLGYRPHTLKTLVFALSAMFAGIAGGLQALNIEAGNYVLFDVKLSTDAVLFAYIGGVNAFLGPVLGASILTFLSQTLADITRSWLLYQGILFVLVMLFVPDGLVGLRAPPAAARARTGRLAAARRRIDGRRPAADGRHGLHGGTAATHVRPRLPLAAGPEPPTPAGRLFPCSAATGRRWRCRPG